jgi:hypothetical protein
MQANARVPRAVFRFEMKAFQRKFGRVIRQEHSIMRQTGMSGKLDLRWSRQVSAIDHAPQPRIT